MNATNEIRFDVDPNGTPRCFLGKKRLPSVGTILRNAAKAYNPWAKDEVDAAARARMDRGANIHEWLAISDRGELGQYDAADYDSVKPQLEAWSKIKAHYKVTTFFAIEEKRANVDDGYWGIIDRAVDMNLILEIKTGSARPSSYRVQAAGYCRLWGAKEGRIIYIQDDGSFELQRDVEEVTQEDFEAFEMALKLAKRKALG